jgi:hypothetical protein
MAAEVTKAIAGWRGCAVGMMQVVTVREGSVR